jgi:phage terminase small subunit
MSVPNQFGLKSIQRSIQVSTKRQQMGQRGPKADPAKPNSRTKSQGNRQTSSTAYGHQQLRKLVAGEPVPPSWLDKGQLVIWAEFVPHLFEAGLTHVIDAHLLGAYCVEWSEYLAAKAALKKLKKGEPRTDLQKQAKDAFVAATAISDRFGGSYKSRTAQGIKMTGSGPSVGEGGASNIGKEAKKAAWDKRTKGG